MSEVPLYQEVTRSHVEHISPSIPCDHMFFRSFIFNFAHNDTPFR
jgi:hypothetical protein